MSKTLSATHHKSVDFHRNKVCMPFFSMTALKLYIRGQQSALKTALREEKNLLFHFSVKDFVNFSKKSKDTGPT